ncbi:putative sodium-coupled neutral amino acid transporter 11 isoform X2 [Artemia franciscana]|uniref:putative sodium-coupled neutral amino acid transporter 11 isoform X2 n=1 Tax=Artemia franciscana TaxID=6661 RepID=UPI0032D9AE71
MKPEPNESTYFLLKQSYGSRKEEEMIESKAEIDSFGDDDADQLIEDDFDPSEKLGILSTGFNYVNSITGSGVIGMTYALSRAGLAFGIAMMLFFAFITDFSLRILVESGRITGANSYQGVVYAAFGIPGYIILTLLQFIYPVVGDTLTKVFNFYLDSKRDSFWSDRNFIVAVVTVVLTLPLSLKRGMSKLSSASMVSMTLTIFIMGIIFVRMKTYLVLIPESYTEWTLFGRSITEAAGIMTFAFMCHHSTFLLVGSLQDPTPARWNKVTHASVIVSTLIHSLFGIGGYLTFFSLSQGNLLENYCSNDHLVNAARIAFCITILLTYPIECFVARDVIEITFCLLSQESTRQRNRVRQMLSTVLLVAAACFISFATDCLGVSLEINGIIAAIPLAFILPSLCYIKLSSLKWKSWMKIKVLALAIFGSIVALSGIFSILTGESRTCTHGEEPIYCISNNQTVNFTLI